MRAIAVFIVLAVLFGAACGNSPSSPSSQLDGRWRGTISRAGVVGTVLLEMTTSGASVAGTWSSDFDDNGADQAGAIAGTVAGPNVSLFLAPAVPLSCEAGPPLSGTLTLNGVVDGNRLQGDYSAFTCGGAATGRIEVVRE
jgi:hypothetical protein